VNVDGIPAFKVDRKTNILLHVNDPMPIFQSHQGKQSERKPDVVIVSHKTALGATAQPETQQSQVPSETPCKSPKDNFQWADVLSTLEFKRTRKSLADPPAVYTTDYVVPTSVQYMEYKKDTNGPSKPTSSTPAAGSAGGSAQTLHEASHECKQ
jgi:hypothetical protein